MLLMEQEQICVTLGVQRRLQDMMKDIKSNRVSVRRLLREMRTSRPTLLRWGTLRSYPTLDRWMFLGDKLGWNLSRDVNYLYAMQAFKPQELMRRLKRLGITTAEQLSEKVHRPLIIVRSIVTGHSAHTCLNWCKVVTYIAQRERDRGYTDALDIEE